MAAVDMVAAMEEAGGIPVTVAAGAAILVMEEAGGIPATAAGAVPAGTAVAGASMEVSIGTGAGGLMA